MCAKAVKDDLPDIGEKLDDRYKLTGHLGRGGMGVVYQALDEETGQQIALKVIDPKLMKEPHVRDRFRREVQVLHFLDHPNIVKIFDHGRDRDFYYFTMELITGPNLSAFVDPVNPLPLDQVLILFGQICSAIEHSHNRGVVHRDLKPTNIVIQDSKTSKLLDFGLARLSDSAALTLPGQALGTAAYMAPEVGRGEEAAPASDIYALGCLFYQLATGVLPFQGDTSVEIIAKHQNKEPIPMRNFRPDAPEEMEVALAKALAKDPRSRYPSAIAFFKALSRSTEMSSGGFEDIDNLDPESLTQAMESLAGTGIKWRLTRDVNIPGVGVLGGWQIKPSPDGRMLAVGADAISGPLLYDPHQQIWTRLGDHGAGRNVRTLQWSQDGKALCFANSSRLVIVDMTRNQCLARLDVTNHRPWSIAIIEGDDGKPTPIAVGESGGAVSWMGWPDAPPEVFRIHRGVARTIVMHPSGHYFVTGGVDGNLHFWRTNDSKLLSSIKLERAAVWNLTYSQSGSYLAATSSQTDAPVMVYALKDKKLQQQETIIRGRAISAVFSQSERLLAVGCHERICFLEKRDDDVWETIETVSVPGEVRYLTFWHADRVLFAVTSVGTMVALERIGSRTSQERAQATSRLEEIEEGEQKQEEDISPSEKVGTTT